MDNPPSAIFSPEAHASGCGKQPIASQEIAQSTCRSAREYANIVKTRQASLLAGTTATAAYYLQMFIADVRWTVPDTWRVRMMRLRNLPVQMY
jgi:hypothetical protein